MSNHVTCQAIRQDQSRWNNIAQDNRNAWNRCHDELKNLEDSIDRERIKRLRLFKFFRNVSFLILLFGNIISGLTALFPIIKYDIPNSVMITFTVITFISTLTMWSRLENKGNKYLVQAEDLNRLSEFCQSVRERLNKVMEDGIITESELFLIKRMLTQLLRKSEEIGSFNLFIKLFGQSEDRSQYRQAFDGVSNIIDSMNQTQQIQQTTQTVQLVRSANVFPNMSAYEQVRNDRDSTRVNIGHINPIN